MYIYVGIKNIYFTTFKTSKLQKCEGPETPPSFQEPTNQEIEIPEMVKNQNHLDTPILILC